MKKLFSKHFQEMIQETLQDGYQWERPATEVSIIELQVNSQKKLKTELPIAFCEFLRLMDGYDDFGIVLFGTKQRPGINGGWVYGVLEFNTEIFCQFPELIVLGKSGDDYLVYDSKASTYKFKNLDSTANNLNAEFTTFSDLIDDIIIPLLVKDED